MHPYLTEQLMKAKQADLQRAAVRHRAAVSVRAPESLAAIWRILRTPSVARRRNSVNRIAVPTHQTPPANESWLFPLVVGGRRRRFDSESDRRRQRLDSHFDNGVVVVVDVPADS